MREGYSYHIKDEYFNLVNDPGLMSNKENRGHRPHYYCLEDSAVEGLFWVVPISSKVEKYEALCTKKLKRNGICNTIVIGKFGGKKCAFLIQNMFPIIGKYVDHIHVISGEPVTVHRELAAVIRRYTREILILEDKGKHVVFSDIKSAKQIMIEELHNIDLEQLPLDKLQQHIEDRRLEKIAEMQEESREGQQLPNDKIKKNDLFR